VEKFRKWNEQRGENELLTIGFAMTARKRISSEALEALTSWRVIYDRASAIQSAGTIAGVNATHVHACLRGIAIVVDHTLWPTVHVGITEIVFHATTRTNTISFFTHCIHRTRVWIARHGNFGWL
jgi:hypothetical protein